MNATLLFDLDDTLLLNDADRFTAAYIHSLAQYLSALLDSNTLIENLLAATSCMVANTDPRKTLKEVFDERFYPGLRIDRMTIDEKIHQFYRDVYPTLRPLTRPRPEVVPIIDGLMSQGFPLAVATNPLFPLEAVYQRLAWAGLPYERYPFKVITAYENFHFAKPNPAYYTEVIALLGAPNEIAVMVGNDLSFDIQPAENAGLLTYWINADGLASVNDSAPTQRASGTFEAFPAWLDSLTDPTEAKPTPTSVLATLRATPAAIQSMVHLPGLDLASRPIPGEWSLTEILYHLRDVEREVYIPRVRQIAENEDPFIPGQDTDRWAEERQYALQDGAAAFDDFVQSRIELLQLLEALDQEGWKRAARHAIFGRTTQLELAGFIAAHDRAHLHQIRQTLDVSLQARV